MLFNIEAGKLIWGLKTLLARHLQRIVIVSSSFVTPWTVACQDSLSMGFPRQKYWSRMPFPSPRHLPDSGIEPMSPVLQADSLLLSHSGSLLKRMPLPKLLLLVVKMIGFSAFQLERRTLIFATCSEVRTHPHPHPPKKRDKVTVMALCSLPWTQNGYKAVISRLPRAFPKMPLPQESGLLHAQPLTHDTFSLNRARF